MDGLSAAASVIAVVDISAKLLVLCSQYYKAVSSAHDDIERLQRQVQGIKTTLDHAKALIESPQGVLLSASRNLENQLGECKSILETLCDKLETRSQKTKLRQRVRALKWPFSSKEVDATILSLERPHRQIMDGLLVDQTNLLLHIKDDVEAIAKKEDASDAKRAHFMVHFDQDPNFVSRPAIQEQIDGLLAGTASRIALIGLGGFGKSQIAINIAYTVHSANPEKSVFWVYGASRATFEDSYRSIAEKLSLPGRQDPNTNILALVRDWLQRDDVAPWLFILDNADELGVFFDKNEGLPLASYLPRRSSGKIFITSRDRNVAERLTGSQKATIPVPTMNRDEALALLQDRLVQEHDQAAADDLILTLDFIPLAIHQAAAYINRRRISIKAYIEAFSESEQKRTKLLMDDAGDIRRHESVSNSVAGTWQVTFDHIGRESPTAVDLLFVLSCFQPQAIPRKTLDIYEHAMQDAKREEAITKTLDDDLDLLFAYSLIQESTDARRYNMHPLVQTCIQSWLSKIGVRESVEELFIKLVRRHLSDNIGTESWQESLLLISHVERQLEIQPDNEDAVEHWVDLLNIASRYLIDAGSYEKAKMLTKRALEAGKGLSEQNYDCVTDALQNLAHLAAHHGYWDGTEQLHLRIAEELGEILEEHHPEKLAAMNRLAQTYKYQGKLEEAEAIYLEELEICNRWRGADDSCTLFIMAGMTDVLREQCRWEEAEKHELKVLEGWKGVAGPEDDNTLMSMTSLALTYEGQDRWDEAEQLHLEVIAVGKRKYGAQHPQTLISMTKLAKMCGNQCRFEEAEALHAQVLEGLKGTLGEDHSYTMNCMYQMVTALHDIGRLLEAERLLSCCLEQSCERLGAGHPTNIMLSMIRTIRERGGDPHETD